MRSFDARLRRLEKKLQKDWKVIVTVNENAPRTLKEIAQAEAQGFNIIKLKINTAVLK